MEFCHRKVFIILIEYGQLKHNFFTKIKIRAHANKVRRQRKNKNDWHGVLELDNDYGSEC